MAHAIVDKNYDYRNLKITYEYLEYYYDDLFLKCRFRIYCNDELFLAYKIHISYKFLSFPFFSLKLSSLDHSKNLQKWCIKLIILNLLLT